MVYNIAISPEKVLNTFKDNKIPTSFCILTDNNPPINVAKQEVVDIGAHQNCFPSSTFFTIRMALCNMESIIPATCNQKLYKMAAKFYAALVTKVQSSSILQIIDNIQ
jgi:hypothetical protein